MALFESVAVALYYHRENALPACSMSGVTGPFQSLSVCQGGEDVAGSMARSWRAHYQWKHGKNPIVQVLSLTHLSVGGCVVGLPSSLSLPLPLALPPLFSVSQSVHLQPKGTIAMKCWGGDGGGPIGRGQVLQCLWRIYQILQFFY